MTSPAIHPLTAVSAFGALATVGENGGGDFSVDNCAALADLSGFGMLTTVEGVFDVSGNPLLTDLSGFGVLEAVGGTLEIDSNDELSDISDLMGLHTIGGDIEFLGNPNLCSEDIDTFLSQLVGWTGDLETDSASCG